MWPSASSPYERHSRRNARYCLLYQPTGFIGNIAKNRGHERNHMKTSELAKLDRTDLRILEALQSNGG